MHKTNEAYDRDSLAEILRAYKLPILIVIIGIILGIGSFLLALKYDVQQSEQTFVDLSDQVYNNFESEMNRHRRQAGSLARVLGELRNFSEDEFLDVANAFTASSYFSHINIYKTTEKDTLENENRSFLIRKYFSKTLSDESETNPFETPELMAAIENSAILKSSFISKPYEITNESGVHSYLVISAPLSEKRTKGLFLVFVIDIQELFNKTLKGENESLSVRVFSVDKEMNAPPDEEMREKVIYEYYVNDASEEFFIAVQKNDFQITSSQKEYYLDDYYWRLHFMPTIENYGSQIGIFPLITFLSAMIITILLSFITFRIKAEQVRTQNIVVEQTKDLQAYTKKLEASNRDLDEFAYIASHDLKEPLRGIYNYAEFLLEDYGDKLDMEAGQKLNTMKKLARRMEKLIETLHDYSRLSRHDMAFEKTAIQPIVEDVVDTMEGWLEKQKAKISINGPLPEIICDPVRTTEVFRNLITNAVKYNNKSIKMVEIGCLEDVHGYDGIPVFYIRDNGIGIAKEHFGSVFKIFKRLHGRDDYGGGTGSGLTIVAKIIERHNGHIWLESQLNKGTTFFFILEKRKSDKNV